jgi:hypothetical protein
LIVLAEFPAAWHVDLSRVQGVTRTGCGSDQMRT